MDKAPQIVSLTTLRDSLYFQLDHLVNKQAHPHSTETIGVFTDKVIAIECELRSAVQFDTEMTKKYPSTAESSDSSSDGDSSESGGDTTVTDNSSDTDVVDADVTV